MGQKPRRVGGGHSEIQAQKINTINCMAMTKVLTKKGYFREKLGAKTVVT